MRLFTITMTGLMLLGITGLAIANPAMLPKHAGYPSNGEFANDTGRKNLTYTQSIEKAAKSGDTAISAVPSDENSGIDLQGVDTSKGAVEQPVKQGVQIPKK